MYVALIIKNAKRMRRIILSSVACPVLQYFSTLLNKRHDFRNKVTECKMYVLIFSTTFFWNTYSKKETIIKVRT